jgi:hypothetical protein
MPEKNCRREPGLLTLRKRSDGVMECWSTGVMNRTTPLKYSGTPELQFALIF